MRELPILMNGPMVRAVLEGRKTVTRRIVKPQPPARNGIVNAAYCGHPNLWLPTGSIGSETPREWKCPYGKPGDRLWVREAFWMDRRDPNVAVMDADGACSYSPNDPDALSKPARVTQLEVVSRNRYFWKRKPSIHMPRWASRITLEVTGVRVERLQDISDEQCIAEGIERDQAYPTLWRRGRLEGDQNTATVTGFPKLAFRSIWEEINGPANWKANPWVWAISFKRIEQERKAG